MKKLYTLLLFLYCAFHLPSVAQGRYTIDAGNVIVSKVVEGITGTKDEIYARAKTYITRAYNSGKDVIQTDDKDNGLIIIKGLYPKLNTYSLGFWYIKAYHKIRIDIKDGRVRLICNVSSLIPNSDQYLGNEYEYQIVDYHPLTTRGNLNAGGKKVQETTFENLVNAMNSSVEALSQSLKGGGVLETEKADW